MTGTYIIKEAVAVMRSCSIYRTPQSAVSLLDQAWDKAERAIIAVNDGQTELGEALLIQARGLVALADPRRTI